MIHQDHTDFVHTGPGTLAGRYLRMFWQPVYRGQDLAPGQAVPIRIMSEDFTLYRGESGRPYVIAPRCAHRATRLSTGWVEEDCLRCFYHGWKYDGTGQCVEQPGEEASFAAKVKLPSYPTQEYLGLIFAYFGEGEAPPIRRHPDFEREGVIEAGPPEYWPCNYFNRLDNACDIGHVTFTHRHSILRTGQLHYLAEREIHAEETEYGVRTTNIREGRPTVYYHMHMPNTNQTRSQARVEGSLEDAAKLWVDRLFWRVPVDDENCVSFVVDYLPLKGEAGEAYRARRRLAQETQTQSLQEIGEAILAGKMRLRDVDPELSTYKTFWIEDYVVQCGQGTVADRANERLGRVDVGVVIMRKIWERELLRLSKGLPLKAWTEPEALADMSVMLTEA
jgi:5,5'-dehydrodivanillate O-demethylase oxygenase subunit